LPRIKMPKAYVFSLAFSPDGKMLAATARVLPRQNWVAFLYDVSTGKQLRQWEAPTGPLYRLTFTPDGKALAGADFTSQTIVLLDLSGKEDRARVIAWGDGAFALS